MPRRGHRPRRWRRPLAGYGGSGRGWSNLLRTRWASACSRRRMICGPYSRTAVWPVSCSSRPMRGRARRPCPPGARCTAPRGFRPAPCGGSSPCSTAATPPFARGWASTPCGTGGAWRSPWILTPPGPSYRGSWAIPPLASFLPEVLGRPLVTLPPVGCVRLDDAPGTAYHQVQRNREARRARGGADRTPSPRLPGRRRLSQRGRLLPRAEGRARRSRSRASGRAPPPRLPQGFERAPLSPSATATCTSISRSCPGAGGVPRVPDPGRGRGRKTDRRHGRLAGGDAWPTTRDFRSPGLGLQRGRPACGRRAGTDVLASPRTGAHVGRQHRPRDHQQRVPEHASPWIRSPVEAGLSWAARHPGAPWWPARPAPPPAEARPRPRDGDAPVLPPRPHPPRSAARSPLGRRR